jgi:glycosyltransferase involved in cell wall biosynthesis
MRVRFDDQIVMYQHRGGVSRYFVELVQGLHSHPRMGVSVDFDWRDSTNEHAVAAGLGLRTGWRRRLDELSRKGPSVLDRQPDLIHPTWYFPARVPSPTGPPIVVTVFDMIPELMPEFFPGGSPHLAKQEYVRTAAAVACISESTRRDLLEIYGGLEATADVVYLGVGPEFRPHLPRPDGLAADYVLFVGNRGLYKDFSVALEAFAGVRNEHPELTLIAVGGGPWKPAETAAIERWSLADAVRPFDASDVTLPAVFANALLFIFPSRYEGFGLPTVEAMAAGTPVIAADSSSHPEVGGDAILYFPPGDAAALGAQMLRILGDSSLASTLAARGIDRAASFTWRRTAEGTRDIYRRTLQDRRG